MRLPFDHNLSHRLVPRLADIAAGSTQTRLLGLAEAPDPVIWEQARQRGLTIVTLDGDFADLSILRGHPPKVLWLRCGNSTVAELESLILRNREQIEAFLVDPSAGYLELWP